MQISGTTKLTKTWIKTVKVIHVSLQRDTTKAQEHRKFESKKVGNMSGLGWTFTVCCGLMTACWLRPFGNVLYMCCGL